MTYVARYNIPTVRSGRHSSDQESVLWRLLRCSSLAGSEYCKTVFQLKLDDMMKVAIAPVPATTTAIYSTLLGKNSFYRLLLPVPMVGVSSGFCNCTLFVQKI